MYTYDDLLSDVKRLKKLGADVCNIGKTVAGREIPSVHIGNYTGMQVLIQGAIHGREHITAQLITQQIYYTIENYGELHGGIYFIPMSNPDGVSLCQFGLDSVKDITARDFLLKINGGADFSLWKANLDAVDLNCNFPARWGKGLMNVCRPVPESYIGDSPAGEPEVKALMEFTLRTRPHLTISYHCKGEEIYWQFGQKGKRFIRDKAYAAEFSRITGYNIIGGDRGSAGGYKDWCIQRLKIPAFTFEAVPDSYQHPVDYAALDGEFQRNKDIPKTALDLLNGE